MKTYEQQINALIVFLAEDGTGRPLSIAHPVGLAIRHIEALEAEVKRLKEGIRDWSYCVDYGMRAECPEKVEELADFLLSVGVAPYSLPKVR